MRYKTLVLKKLEELRYMISGQSSNISQSRPQEELQQQLERMVNKIHEINVLLNTENESL